MSKYEFIISAKDKTAQAFRSINQNIKITTAGLARIGSGTVGAAAALAGITINASKSAKELQLLSDMAGLTVEEFQSTSYAMRQFNISQEELADISKDVQDKLGDFIATGGGEFADFFEQVAPKVGLTAEALKELSGPQVLIAVKNAMDAANISAKEQVFYLESIANDATKLSPILANNGERLKELQAEYEQLNIKLNQTEVDKLSEFNNEIVRLQTQLEGMGNKVAVSLVDPLTSFNDELSEIHIDAILRVERVFIGIDRSITAATLTWYELQDALGQDVDQRMLQNLQGEIDYLDRQWQKLTDQINGTPIAYSLGYGETDDIFAGLDDPFDLTNAVTNVDVKPAAEAIKHDLLSSLSVADEFNANLVDMNSMMQLSSDEFWAEYEEKGLSAYENLNDASENFWDKLQDHISVSTNNFDTMWGNTFDRFTAGMAEATTAVLFEQQSFGDAMKEITRGAVQAVIQGLIEIGIQRLTLFALEKFIGTASASLSVKTAAATGKSIASSYSTAAAMASLASYGMNSIPAMGGLAATVGLSKSLAVAGMAHDGIDNIPREGTWLLDKGERVVDSRTNKDLKNYLNSSNQQASNVSINAPITLGGDVSDEKILRTIERNPKRIARIINRLNGVPA